MGRPIDSRGESEQVGAAVFGMGAMFKNRTLFVVGAGASAEFNLPIGAKLIEQIAAKVDLRWKGYDLVSGDPSIAEALKRRPGGDINPYRHAGQKIAAAMPLALSIDNFMDIHKAN